MIFKKIIGLSLFVSLTGIVGLSFGALAFTSPATISVMTPDGKVKQVPLTDVDSNSKLVEVSTSSDQQDSSQSSSESSTEGGTSEQSGPTGDNVNQGKANSTQSQEKSPANPTSPTKPSAPSPTPSPTQPVVKKPTITLSITPAVISSGASSTLQWSASDSPTSCNASGSWSGAKSASGTQSTGAKATGSYTYTLTCSNSGGTSNTSVTQTVNAPAINYCDGLSPCYGVSQMAQHADQSTCWGYSTYKTGGSFARTYDLVKAYNGTSKHKQSNVGFWTKCGKDITNCINGDNGCGQRTQDHSSGDLSKYSSPNGYYDPRKP